MDVGIVVFNGCAGLDPAALGRAVEERGFESLFYPEHTHIPVRSRRRDGSSTRGFAETYDPFVALAAAAATTSTLRLGTAVCLVTQRDPIVTAKEVASLDLLSGGRFLFGVGAGWNREEMADHGTDPRTRMAVFAERVAAMRAIWTADQAEFHGRYVDFDPLWSWPKPVARPHPPVLVGGNGPGSEDRVLAFGDGWMPQAGHLESVDELERRMVALRRRAAEAGRGPVPVTVFSAPHDRDVLDALAAVGVDRCVLSVRQDGTPDETLSTLDSLIQLASR
ncbi:MAG TPA: LLM class F420-dependent oxidoreductase [Micromonosporaceae bacterium]|nr:LLM class F420-dependent oxidoreductase [Micromonosporaceae bacterium]